MSDCDATSTPSASQRLLQRLCTRGWEFDFFQAVWLLEHYQQDRPGVGEDGPVAREAIRFRPHVSMGFPPTDIRRITTCSDPASDESFYLIDVTFMGLYGVSTPLPLHYAVDILRAENQADLAGAAGSAKAPADGRAAEVDEPNRSTPARSFLDILHHRLVSLFYRSWTKYRYERTYRTPGSPITDYLLYLIGCPRCYEGDELGVSAEGMIRYAGVLTQRPGSAVMLEGVLTDYWENLQVHIDQFVGRWVPLSEDDVNVVGARNTQLGVNLTVGGEVYDWNGAFNIAIGPVDWETYLSFLPDGARFAQTRSLVRLYCTDPLIFTLEVVLDAGEIPPTYLTSDDTAGRLGYTSWVRTEEMPQTSVTFDTEAPAVGSSDPNTSGTAVE